MKIVDLLIDRLCETRLFEMVFERKKVIDRTSAFDWRSAVVSAIRKNLGTATKVEAIRGLFGGAKYNYAANSGDE